MIASVLVMEPGHHAAVMRRFPTLSGRTMLFDHWTGGTAIADPYWRSIEMHRTTRDKIAKVAAGWVSWLRR